MSVSHNISACHTKNHLRYECGPVGAARPGGVSSIVKFARVNTEKATKPGQLPGK